MFRSPHEMLHFLSDKEGVIFFIVTLVYSGYIAFPYIMHCIHLSHFFLLHQKFFTPYILLCTARLSLFHTETLFSPLKYIVYKRYIFFQTKMGSFFSIVTLVYSGCIAFPFIMHCIHLSHFFAASSEIFCPIYSVVHSSFQSVLQ